jgi:hypothetical protein
VKRYVGKVGVERSVGGKSGRKLWNGVERSKGEGGNGEWEKGEWRNVGKKREGRGLRGFRERRDEMGGNKRRVRKKVEK